MTEADVFIGCSGTLVSNELGEFWNIMDMIEPGCLGDKNDFGVRHKGIRCRVMGILRSGQIRHQPFLLPVLAWGYLRWHFVCCRLSKPCVLVSCLSG